MRSLWQDIGAVAGELSQLQEVCVELAATSGRRNLGIASNLCRLEVYVVRGERRV